MLERRTLLSGAVDAAIVAPDLVSPLASMHVQPDAVLIYSPRPEMQFGQAAPVRVVVTTPQAGDALPGGVVTLSDDDGTVLGSFEIADGQGSYRLTGLARGYHHITATYEGDATYAPLDSASTLAVHVGASNIVDILALYTPAAKQDIASYDVNINDLIYQAVADANDALLNSQIDLSLELADVAPVNYVESGSFDTDLTRLSTPGDGYLDQAMSLRNQYGADLVCLFVGSGDMGGLGYVLTDLNAGDNADYGFSVVMAEQAADPTYTLAHELGHNFGAAHDREHADAQGLYGESYGYRFTGDDGVVYHDIMSYDPGQTILYYSNPDVSYAGEPTGRSGYSNVARTINTTAPIVAAYRPTVVPLVTPTVTSVTASGGVIDGRDLTLTATVSGQVVNPHSPTGTVTFLDGDAVLGTADVTGGVATWTGQLSAGSSHSIRAIYFNDDYFGDSISSPLALDTAPVASVSLSPLSVGTQDMLTATATKYDAEGQDVSLTFTWRVNGVVRSTFTSATALSDTFDLGQPGNGDRGDTVSVRVTPSDGIASGAAAVASVTVENTEPTLRPTSATVNAGGTLNFTTADFDRGFVDIDSADTLRRVRIMSLPTSGTLSLAGTPVVAGQQILAGSLGQLSYSPDAQANDSDSFTWTGSDGLAYAGPGETSLFTVLINHAPVDLSLSSALVMENQSAGTLVGRFIPADPDTGNTFTYALVAGDGSDDNSLFVISGKRLITKAPLDYETQQPCSIRVRVTDQGGLSVEKVLTIDLGDLPEAPYDLVLPIHRVAENLPAGTPVGPLIARDPDRSNTFIYALIGTASYPDNAAFTIDGNQLLTAGALDYETKSTYTIRVRVTDQTGLSYAKTLTVNVKNVNEAPTTLGIAGRTVAENKPAGTVVGTFSTTDPDAGNTFTYSLVDGDGSADNAAFTILGNQLLTAGSFDFEAKSTYSIRVRTTDQGGLFCEKAISIRVSDVNEAPTALSLSNSTVLDGQPIGTLVGVLSGTDPDASSTLSYSLVAGVGSRDNAMFTLLGRRLRTAAVFNYAAKSLYKIRVRVTDQSGLWYEKAMLINVTAAA